MLSLMTIFKDVLPGYKIRSPTEQELQVKVTKAVQKLRDFERTLLKAFQAYLKLLRSVANSTSAPISHVRCGSGCCPRSIMAAGVFSHVRWMPVGQRSSVCVASWMACRTSTLCQMSFKCWCPS